MERKCLAHNTAYRSPKIFAANSAAQAVNTQNAMRVEAEMPCSAGTSITGAVLCQRKYMTHSTSRPPTLLMCCRNHATVTGSRPIHELLLVKTTARKKAM